MRWLFLLLLALNVIYFGREFDRETAIRYREAVSVPPVPASARSLSLLAELPSPPPARTYIPEPVIPEPAPDTTESSTLPQQMVTEMPEIALPADVPVVTTWTCYRYGPLLDQDQIEMLDQWFVDRNAGTRTSFIEEQGRQLYWIYMAPQPSRENAMAVLQEMQNKGIGDFRLINRGDLQNAISLGLFSSREAVNARLEELKEQGYVPVVVPYADVKRIYSLDVRIADASGLSAELEQGFPARFDSEVVECPPVTASEYSPPPSL